MLWWNVIPVDGIDVLLLFIFPSAPFLASLEVADIELGTIHDIGLISVLAYNFVCSAKGSWTRREVATDKTLHLCALVRFLAGHILTVAIKSTLSNARSGGASSGLGCKLGRKANLKESLKSKELAT